MSGGILTQHCTGKGSLLYPCALPTLISPDGRQCIFYQLGAAATTSTGLEQRESKFTPAWRVGATGLHVEIHASYLSDSIQQHGLEHEGHWRAERKVKYRK